MKKQYVLSEAERNKICGLITQLSNEVKKDKIQGRPSIVSMDNLNDARHIFGMVEM